MPAWEWPDPWPAPAGVRGADEPQKGTSRRCTDCNDWVAEDESARWTKSEVVCFRCISRRCDDCQRPLNCKNSRVWTCKCGFWVAARERDIG